MSNSKWIWYPDSLELYHGMLLHNRRTSAKAYASDSPSSCAGQTRSVYYFPMWKVFGPERNAQLSKTATIYERETIEFLANTPDASITVDGHRYCPNTKITIEPGEHTVTVSGFHSSAFPAFYIKGRTFTSDRSYKVCSNDIRRGESAGCSELYTSPEDNPCVFKFEYKRIDPASVTAVEGGHLYDFGKEVFGKINVSIEGFEGGLVLYLGESYEEATDTQYTHTVINAQLDFGVFTSSSVACRYVFIKGFKNAPTVTMDYEYLPMVQRGSFMCDNEQINDLWNVCAYTMQLNSREAFFDGIKRDRWVWSGDAYQSYFVNYYLCCDKEIVKRTARMLRGGDPIVSHINTITDYTFYWIISIWDYYFHTGDKDFVLDIYKRMLSMWEFVEKRLDSDGMFKRHPEDWVFMDWSTFDSDGPMCAEQMLLARAYEALSGCAELNGDTSTAERCRSQAEYIINAINERYWDKEKGAFIDSYTSGRRNVTRHANIFAILFNYTSQERIKSIIENVIYNKNITPITTPYFEFFELDAMCKIGDFGYMTHMLDSYFCGMLNLGATTIWEEFDPTKSGIEHYEMYDGKYEKSLCHAWGASPIYLLGKYALGVYPTGAGYSSYAVKPSLMDFGRIEGKVPVPNGEIEIKMDKNSVSVLSPIEGGVLIVSGKEYIIPKDSLLEIQY